MSTVTNYMLGSTQVRNIYYGSNLIWPLTHDYSQDCFTIESTETSNEIRIGQYYNNYDVIIEYNINDTGWQSLTIPTNSSWGSFVTVATINTGDYIRFRHEGTLRSNYTQTSIKFMPTKNFIVYGNIMSLQDGANFVNSRTISYAYQFNSLFRFSSIDPAPYPDAKIISAENLVLPATTLMPGCYSNLFNYCPLLITPPKILPASTLTTSCYAGMFEGCTSLTTAPDLLAKRPADYAYRNMFRNCSSLSYIKCLLDPTTSYVISSWVYGVAAYGTFVRDPNSSYWTVGNNGIPSGWTVVPPLSS